MANEPFHLAFDVATSHRTSVGLLAILPAVGRLLVLIPQRFLDRIPGWHPKGALGKALAIAFLALSLLVSGIVWANYHGRGADLQRMARQGSLRFTEGCLQGFHPMPEAGHDLEHLWVNGLEFTYSDFVETSPAFNHTEAHGGPIHADSAVRIWHYGNEIARLEVSDHACPAAPDPRLPQGPAA